MGRPANKRRKKIQKKRRQLQTVREDLQLMGAEPTVSEGAIRDERVNPASQGEQQLPALVRQGLKENWATPDAAKPRIVGALLEPFFTDDVVLDKDGNQVRVPPSRGLLLQNAKALKDLDQAQWERDHPKEVAKMEQNVQVNVVDTNTLWRKALEESGHDEIEARLKQERGGGGPAAAADGSGRPGDVVRGDGDGAAPGGGGRSDGE